MPGSLALARRESLALGRSLALGLASRTQLAGRRHEGALIGEVPRVAAFVAEWSSVRPGRKIVPVRAAVPLSAPGTSRSEQDAVRQARRLGDRAQGHVDVLVLSERGRPRVTGPLRLIPLVRHTITIRLGGREGVIRVVSGGSRCLRGERRCLSAPRSAVRDAETHSVEQSLDEGDVREETVTAIAPESEDAMLSDS